VELYCSVFQAQFVGTRAARLRRIQVIEGRTGGLGKAVLPVMPTTTAPAVATISGSVWDLKPCKFECVEPSSFS